MLSHGQAQEPDQHQVRRSTVHDVLRSSGDPLDEPTRTEMEARLGADFSDVRVHTDTAARASAAEIGARAYTSGNHVVIGDEGADRHTLAHELTHVLQQRSGLVAGTEIEPGLTVSDPGDRFERAAEANADRVMASPVPRTVPGVAKAKRDGAITALNRITVQRTNGTTTPVLRGVPQPGEDEEGLCGNFARVREWEIVNPQRGVIIQEVTREFDVQRYTPEGWVALNGSDLDAYVAPTGGTADATVLRYWELWQVDANGVVGDGGSDTFGMTSLIQSDQVHDTTKGRLTIRGRAWFYVTDQDPTTLGFRRHAVRTAGGLFSATNPNLSLLNAPASGPITYTVRASWDSTDKRKPADKNKPRNTVYRPREAWSKVEVQ